MKEAFQLSKSHLQLMVQVERLNSLSLEMSFSCIAVAYQRVPRTQLRNIGANIFIRAMISLDY